MATKPTPPPKSDSGSASSTTTWSRALTKLFIWAVGLVAAGVLSVVMLVAIGLAVAFPNLPDLSDLSDYRPKLPLRIYSAEGDLLGEFGEERRTLTPIDNIPDVMIDAVLAIEDARFYQHSGVDYLGVIRAGLANVSRAKSQGASTIT
ncbi:MAG: penicillin-binding protein, partial [Betaproteobacteria bacterium]|nr:penicillin-binding protein [Betaproteobacteria bacterium]